jgi:hypothetical protein
VTAAAADFIRQWGFAAMRFLAMPLMCLVFFGFSV